MKAFSYVIKDEIGIHARPAGQLVNEAKKYESTIMVKCGGKSADAKKLIALMSMGVKCGDEVEITVDGADEEQAFQEIKAFFENQL